MGHEYVEMKNTPAAIDAYRKAVDINPRDYHAKYGLGQAYEMMGMSFYALYYFWKSYLRSNDPRLWIDMAQCCESAPLQMYEEAIKCYTRAANSNDTEGIALHQLAKLHSILGHSEQAEFYYKKDIERMETDDHQGPNMIEVLLFLAKQCKAEGRFEEAEVYCTRLLDTSKMTRNFLLGKMFVHLNKRVHLGSFLLKFWHNSILQFQESYCTILLCRKRRQQRVFSEG